MEQLKIEMPANDDFFSTILNPVKFTMQTVMADTMLGMLLGLVYAPIVRRNSK